MARFIWIDIAVKASQREVDLDWLSIPSPPRVLCANLLVGSAREQLNEESRAVSPGPSGLVAWAG
ncbi:hypothetical protein JOQ06_020247, partial [Pogonophryne albipinna]